jgi:ribokinase
VLKPCKSAARELTGLSDPEDMAYGLLDLGPSVVALTAGEEGCYLATKEEVVHSPAFDIRVVDTTGAGDAFMGGLSYAMKQGWELSRVAAFANACAAFCCTMVGARAMGGRTEVEKIFAGM